MNHRPVARIAILLAACALAAGCATSKPVPEWQSDARSALDDFRRHYLAGDVKLAERSLVEARHHVSATGDPAMAARVELIRCAVTTAALDFTPCDNVRESVLHASGEDRAYAAFVTGNWAGLDRARLPAQYRGVAARADDGGRLAALRAIEDPLSRLVAAGALFRQTGLPPEGVEVAVDTASAQGYRRPLLAWLRTQEKLASAAGDSALADRIRRRIELAGGDAGVRRP